jgi:hypothetical protein
MWVDIVMQSRKQALCKHGQRHSSRTPSCLHKQAQSLSDIVVSRKGPHSSKQLRPPYTHHDIQHACREDGPPWQPQPPNGCSIRPTHYGLQLTLHGLHGALHAGCGLNVHAACSQGDQGIEVPVSEALPGNLNSNSECRCGELWWPYMSGALRQVAHLTFSCELHIAQWQSKQG